MSSGWTPVLDWTPRRPATLNHKLNGDLAGGKGDIGGVGRFVDQPFAISPDSRWVVYLADQAAAGVYELWSVPITDGEPTRLNGPLVPGGDVAGADGDVDYTFRISPDSQRVVYLADQATDEVVELWRSAVARPYDSTATWWPVARSAAPTRRWPTRSAAAEKRLQDLNLYVLLVNIDDVEAEVGAFKTLEPIRSLARVARSRACVAPACRASSRRRW